MDVRALCERLGHPMWMPDPDNWWWARPAGGLQGIGNWREEPGLANLLWLTMEMGTPPTVYEFGPMATWVLLHGERAGLWHAASVHSLQDFHDGLRAHPDLQKLAARRLHAHT